MAAAPAKPLNHRQISFVLAYIANGGNKTKAAIEAGYSAKAGSAARIGTRLSRNVQIQAEIARRSHKVADRVEITAERILREAAHLAFLDPRRLLDADGNPLALKDLPDDVAACIASIEPVSVEIGKGKDKRLVERHKLRFWDKNASLEKLFRFARLYAEAPPPPGGTTNILNVNIDGIDVENRAKIRELLRLAAEGTG